MAFRLKTPNYLLLSSLSIQLFSAHKKHSASVPPNRETLITGLFLKSEAIFSAHTAPLKRGFLPQKCNQGKSGVTGTRRMGPDASSPLTTGKETWWEPHQKAGCEDTSARSKVTASFLWVSGGHHLNCEYKITVQSSSRPVGAR